MAILRLTNGNDVSVKLDVADTIAALEVVAGRDGFVELPTDDGPIHLRPSSIIAVLEDFSQKRTGFRVVP